MRILIQLVLLLLVAAAARAQDKTAPVPDDLQDNINARYTVESVEIVGIDLALVPSHVHDELKTLVGKQMDPKEVERLERRLDAFLEDHQVARRIERGTQPGQVKVIFDVTSSPRTWIPFRRTQSKLLYHAYHGWGGALDVPMGNRSHKFTIGGSIQDEDEHVEQISGWRFRYESLRLGTDRFGASLEYSTLRQTWREASLDAIDAAGLPEAYRARHTIEPFVTFAITPSIRLTGGASISELQSLSRSPESQIASALVGGVSVNHRWDEGGATQNIFGSYEVRSASDALNSDLDYDKHRFSFGYRLSRNRSVLTTNFVLGRLSGDAPMFERFTLGDTRTLRGWNKYDIAPAGASRMFHHTVEYRYSRFGVYLDSGAVWEPDADVDTRFATGFNVVHGPFFATLGVPLNAGEVRLTFMAGLRMGLEIGF